MIFNLGSEAQAGEQLPDLRQGSLCSGRCWYYLVTWFIKYNYLTCRRVVCALRYVCTRELANSIIFFYENLSRKLKTKQTLQSSYRRIQVGILLSNVCYRKDLDPACSATTLSAQRLTLKLKHSLSVIMQILCPPKFRNRMS